MADSTTAIANHTSQAALLTADSSAAEIVPSKASQSHRESVELRDMSASAPRIGDRLQVSTVPDSPFEFTPQQLYSLIDPKSVSALKELGGLEGILRGLKVDPAVGLTEDPHDEDERKRVFGENVVPQPPSKTLLQLMLDAFQDRILIMLSVAALAALAFGLYEDLKYKDPLTTPDEELQKTHWIEGFAIIVAVLVVVFVGSLNDYQKELQFRKLNAKKDDRMTKVLRKGEKMTISVFKVLPGDILLVEPGDLICADGIYITGGIKTDESAATGESDTIKKNADKDPFFLSGSKVTEGVGRYVVTGVGVNSFFGRTMQGLQVEAEDTPLQIKLDALAEQIAKMGAIIAITMFIVLIIKYVVTIATGDGGFSSVTGSQIGEQIISVVIAAITIVVVAVPEGLPLAVTLALAFATSRMISDNCLVRLRSACETMGGVTTICSDKTGTLTQNKMTVVKGTIGTTYSFDSEEEVQKLQESVAALATTSTKRGPSGAVLIDRLFEGVALNSTAFESVDEISGTKVFIGSKTETALLEWVTRAGAQYRQLRDAVYIKIKQIYPFSSERKSMSILLRIEPAARKAHPTGETLLDRPYYRIHVKGASEIVLKLCDKTIVLPTNGDEESRVEPMSSSLMRSFNQLIVSYASQTLRTICIAYRDFTEDEFNAFLSGPIREAVHQAKLSEAREEANRKRSEEDVLVIGSDEHGLLHDDTDPAERTVDDLTDEEVLAHPLAQRELASYLTCLGIVGIEDPLRPSVTDAVEECHRAGVIVRMVTGDNVLTAKSIAAKCGILTRGGVVMEGPQFRALSPEKMDALLPRLQVLARSSPTDKQILVGRLKYLGETVAVTGDGTNDGPALKMADVGFSMGIAGTDVAKEASSMVLMDDNFSSIVKAMMWGRTVSDSVKKFLMFQLTVNISAVLVAFITAVAGAGEKSVLTAVQLLWVNLIMDTLAALALATDRPQPDILARPPQSKTSRLISISMWKMIIFQAIFQIAVNLSMYFAGAQILQLKELAAAGGPSQFNPKAYPTDKAAQAAFEIARNQYAVLRTVVFNTFVLLQMFNQINCRQIDHNLNIFKGIHKNPYFISIFFGVMFIQIIIVEFGANVFNTVPINGVQWAVCIVIGFLSIPLGLIIRLIPDEAISFLFPRRDEPPTGLAAALLAIQNRADAGVISSASHMASSPHTVSAQEALERLDPAMQARLNWAVAINTVKSETSVFRALRGRHGSAANLPVGSNVGSPTSPASLTMPRRSASLSRNTSMSTPMIRSPTNPRMAIVAQQALLVHRANMAREALGKQVKEDETK
ncbi:PMCA-type calcium-translocating P-type ATPase [Cladochytrium replicatum]|nr:PMCA-type calcium-translocating P-type ATPase [Cladochytrium replicatum]